MLRVLLILLITPTLIFPAAFLNKKAASVHKHEQGLEFTLVTKQKNENENIFKLADTIQFVLTVKNISKKYIDLTQLTGGQFASFIIYKKEKQIAYIHANYGLLVTQSLIPIRLAPGEGIVSKESVPANEFITEYGQYKVISQSGLLLNDDMINLSLSTHFYVRN